MELVPILSTIILVGTIATFILAVAAYVLYKVREAQGRKAKAAAAANAPAGEAPPPEPHMLVSPAGAPAGALPGPPMMNDQMYLAPNGEPMMDYGQMKGMQNQYGPPTQYGDPNYGAGMTTPGPYDQQAQSYYPTQYGQPTYDPNQMGNVPPQTQQPYQAPQESLFWEYTDAGFKPVQTSPQMPQGQTQGGAPPQQNAPQQQQEGEDGFAWL